MSNNFTAIVNLGADPETIQLGDREGRKLRLADKARGKKAITRWFNMLVTGKDCEVADRLRKGDSILVTGELALTEYKPKKAKKGEMVRADEMPFGKILQVVKSPSFFGVEEGDDAEEELPGKAGVVETEAPDLDGGADPLADIGY